MSTDAQDASTIAGPSREGWHTVTIKVPFHTPAHALIAKQALEVDREQNGTFVERQMDVEGDELVVKYSTSTIRLLRLSTNSFFSSLDLVTRTMSSFAPDPSDKQVSDEELEQIRLRANAPLLPPAGSGSSPGAGSTGTVKVGIELKGDGKGAGSGEEVR